MRLTQVPNLRVEDYRSEQSWIGRFFISMNPFIQSLSQVLDQNIDYATNIKSVTREYSIENFQSFSLLWPFEGFAPQDLRIIKATRTSAQTPTVLLPTWSYNPETESVTIVNILEVTENGIFVLSGPYRFTVRVTI